MGENPEDLHLSQLLTNAVATAPERIAVEEDSGRRLTYSELSKLADRIATRFARWGISRGDRVGLLLPKGIEAVASIHSVLGTGAAYVPVDPSAPVRRSATILSDAGVRAIVVHGSLVTELLACWTGPGPAPRLIVVGDATKVLPQFATTWEEVQSDEAPSPLPPRMLSTDLAYILYTSGSTGSPKGVMLTHQNAFCFLDWCTHHLDLQEGDRFSAHAPFHFDLSIFDIFACCQHAGTLAVVSESLAKDPVGLARFLSSRKLDVWYSAPSILAMMVDLCRQQELKQHSPRVVLFAGEVFPIRSLKLLRTAWPDAKLWNLYGPTETNVCTAHQIPSSIPDEQTTPFPIGKVCPPLKSRVIDEFSRDVPPGIQGELLISGPGVMRGYFDRPDMNLLAFVRDSSGETWYRTGDLVIDDGNGCFEFHGRRDRMVKKRGYRIELGEIESALHQYPEVQQVAVVSRSEPTGVSIQAFLVLKPECKASIIAIKRHCTLHLPAYMVPDQVYFLPVLPLTSTDKVDYQLLTTWTTTAANTST